jgi:hypothetical protein
LSENKYNNSSTDIVYFGNYCKEILSTAFQTFFESNNYTKNIDEINMLYKHRVALSDKLNII